MSAPTDDAVGRVAKELDRQRSWGGMAWVDAPRVSVPTDALRAVLARLAECERDAARVDWLEERGVSLVGVSVPLADTGDYAEVWEVRQQVMRGKDELLGWDTDIRLAIDAAREGATHG